MRTANIEEIFRSLKNSLFRANVVPPPMLQALMSIRRSQLMGGLTLEGLGSPYCNFGFRPYFRLRWFTSSLELERDLSS